MTTVQRRRRWGIALCLLAVLLGWVLAGFSYTQGFARDNLPNMVEHRRLMSAGKDEGISFYDLSVYEDELNYDKLAGYREVNLPVDLVENAQVVLCNESVPEVYEFDMVTGSTFTREMVEQNLPYAIISDELALERYLTLSAVGQKITIDNCEYVVIGVYDSHKVSGTTLPGTASSASIFPTPATQMRTWSRSTRWRTRQTTIAKPCIINLNPLRV